MNIRYKNLNIIFQILKLLFLSLALVLIAYAVYSSKEKLLYILTNANLTYLSLSVLVWTGMQTISPAVTHFLMQSMGVNLSWNSAMSIHANRLPTKYLPGGIWNSVSRFMDYRNHGIDFKIVSVYTILENILVVVASFSLGGAIIGIAHIKSSIYAIYLLLLCMLIVLLILAYPIFRKNNVQWKTPFYLSVGLYFIYWLVAGFSFLLFYLSLESLDYSHNSIEVMGIYILSWSIGFASFFSPQGIGVSEYVAGWLLDGASSLYLISVLFLFRVVVLVADMITFFVSRLLVLVLGNSRKNMWSIRGMAAENKDIYEEER